MDLFKDPIYLVCVTVLCVKELRMKEFCLKMLCVCVKKTQKPCGCHQVPRMPYKVRVDGAKCHTCHAKELRRRTDQGAPPEPGQCRKCHACHTKRRWMSPSATPATQSAAAPRATMQTQAPHQSQPNAASATQKGRQCHQVTDLLKFHFSIYISNRWIFVVNLMKTGRMCSKKK